LNKVGISHTWRDSGVSYRVQVNQSFSGVGEEKKGGAGKGEKGASGARLSGSGRQRAELAEQPLKQRRGTGQKFPINQEGKLGTGIKAPINKQPGLLERENWAFNLKEGGGDKKKGGEEKTWRRGAPA